MSVILKESQWQHEDRLNAAWTPRRVDRMLSRKFQAKMRNSVAGRALDFQLQKDLVSKPTLERRALLQEQSAFRGLELQQQEAGFQFPGGGLTVPAACIYYASSWNIGTTYPASPNAPAGGTGYPAVLSYIQYQGTIYAITGSTPSTPGTPPTGGVWVALTTAAPLWTGANPSRKLSLQWASPAGTFPAPFGAAGVPAVDVVDSYWDIPETQNLAAVAANFYIPAPGRGFVVTATAQGVLQLNIAGSWTTVFTNTALTFQYIEIDGLTARWLSTGTANTALLFYRIRQGSQS
jgi:hypothetical protein